MTPAEVAAKLRAFNEWRRGDEDIPQPDPREIGKAIDAAVEMIDRLEAAEEDIALKEKVIDALGSELNAIANERDALRAKIEAMKKRLRLILEEPENTMSNSKALREMVRQARLALEETK